MSWRSLLSPCSAYDDQVGKLPKAGRCFISRSSLKSRRIAQKRWFPVHSRTVAITLQPLHGHFIPGATIRAGSDSNHLHSMFYNNVLIQEFRIKFEQIKRCVTSFTSSDVPTWNCCCRPIVRAVKDNWWTVRLLISSVSMKCSRSLISCLTIFQPVIIFINFVIWFPCQMATANLNLPPLIAKY